MCSSALLGAFLWSCWWYCAFSLMGSVAFGVWRLWYCVGCEGLVVVVGVAVVSVGRCFVVAGGGGGVLGATSLVSVLRCRRSHRGCVVGGRREVVDRRVSCCVVWCVSVCVCDVVCAALVAWGSSRRGVRESLPPSVAAAGVDLGPGLVSEGRDGDPERCRGEVSVCGDLEHRESVVGHGARGVSGRTVALLSPGRRERTLSIALRSTRRR